MNGDGGTGHDAKNVQLYSLFCLLIYCLLFQLHLCSRPIGHHTISQYLCLCDSAHCPVPSTAAEQCVPPTIIIIAFHTCTAVVSHTCLRSGVRYYFAYYYRLFRPRSREVFFLFVYVGRPRTAECWTHDTTELNYTAMQHAS